MQVAHRRPPPVVLPRCSALRSVLSAMLSICALRNASIGVHDLIAAALQ
jgi:hypothetical protein